LQRIAPDFAGDVMELDATDPDALANGENEVTFEWAPLDGRALYRVTVERFEWLLPIARSEDAIVWVPMVVEILQNGESRDAGENMQLLRG